jgi:hypothetical protein
LPSCASSMASASSGEQIPSIRPSIPFTRSLGRIYATGDRMHPSGGRVNPIPGWDSCDPPSHESHFEDSCISSMHEIHPTRDRMNPVGRTVNPIRGWDPCDPPSHESPVRSHGSAERSLSQSWSPLGDVTFPLAALGASRGCGPRPAKRARRTPAAGQITHESHVFPTGQPVTRATLRPA